MARRATSTTRPATSRSSRSARSPAAARAYALASTELSLHTLLEEHDFTAAALLLNVLGEGTFLDLLALRRAARARRRDRRGRAARAPRRAPPRALRRSRTSAAGSTRDPDERDALVAAAEARAAKLTSLVGPEPARSPRRSR